MHTSRIIIATLLAFVSLTMRAQGDVEYRAEIGAGAGMVTYQGDFNGSLIKGMQPMGTVVFRRLFNPYMGLKFTGSYGKIKGSSDNVKTYYPDMAQEKFEFNNNLVDISAVYEYNFWPYGTGRDYRGAKRLTPFVFGGIGVTYAEGGDNSVITGNIPLGLGVKYKVADRWNLGVEWTMHFSLTDKLDNVKDPYMVSSSGAFKNTDCYSHLLVTLTYSFLAKCRTCHNADE